MKERLDVLLVKHGLAESEEKARRSLCPESSMWTARRRTRPDHL